MNNFEYLQPQSIEKASNYLSKNSKSIIYAGGTDILGLMKDDIFNYNQLVNLKNIESLDYIRYDENEGLKIGALTKLSEIEKNETVKKHAELLQLSVKEIATSQLRNVGTIGGNICQRPRCFYFRGEYECIRKGGDTCFAVMGNNKYHCIIGGGPCYIVHPSDSAVALLALNAKFKINDGKNEKIVSAKDFFILPEVDDQKENILKNGEILTEIIIPNSESKISKFIKVKERGAWDFALLSIAGIFEINDKIIKTGKITFGGVAPIPWEEERVNNELIGLKINEESVNNLSNIAFEKAEALDMNSYKIILAKNLIKKIFLE